MCGRVKRARYRRVEAGQRAAGLTDTLPAMVNTDDFPTRSSLLRQLHNWENEEAWREFLNGYAELIAGWCRRRGLREDQVDEVVLQIQEKLVSAMPRFTYNRGKGAFGTGCAAPSETK